MSAAGERHRRRTAVAFVLLVAALLAWLASGGGFETIERRLSADRVAADPTTRNRLRSALRRAGALHLQPPERALVEAPRGVDGRCPDPEFGPRPPDALPSSWLAPPELLLPGRGGLSLYLEPCRRRRLESHRHQRGRDWEEVGWISLFRDGELRFATAVGVRIHGRTRRFWKVPSLRLHFRDDLGAPGLPGELLDPELRGLLPRLALKWDPGSDEVRRPWPFVEAVALDVGRRVGAHAPRARPIALSVNGEAPQPYYLIEQVGDEFVRDRFGLADFELLAAKEAAGHSNLPLERESAWLQRQPAPFGRAAAAERYELPRFVDSLVAAAYCGVGDAFQDALLRDRRGRMAGGRWIPILWDLDFAFRDHPGHRRFGRYSDLLPRLFSRQPAHQLPERLLRRVLTEDSDFRAEVGRRFVDALNHELTPEFFAPLLARYAALAEEMALPDREFLARFARYFEERPAVLRRQLEFHFGLAPFHPLDLRAAGGRLVVDGRETATPRRLYFPAGTVVRIAVPPGRRERFAGWNGAGAASRAEAFELTLTISGATELEAVFRPQSTGPLAGSSAQGSRPTG